MGDSVTPIITGMQDQVNQLIGASTKLTPEQAAQVRKDMGGGIETAFSKANATADKNSVAYTQKGLDNVDKYTQYWYDHIRNPSDYTLNAGGTPPTTPQDQSKTITDTATSQTDTLINTFGDLTKTITSQINAGKTDLTNTVAGLTTAFGDSQTSLLQGFQDAQTKQAASMSGLVSQLQAQIAGQNASGNPLKRPNYARALAQNKLLNSGGLGSTMLTGTGGVSTGALPLASTSLLGS